MGRKICFFIVLSMVVLFAAAAGAEDVAATDAEVTIFGVENDILGSVLAVGDFNGDQIPDLFFGAPGG